ncbi:fasciclin-like arabinogalactan protein 9 [Coffea arabica]|uniref:Fasciclin-like arabinogalactan protein 9 n=1 Tax=Coffea arabica TaxID=13443 RepID=A0A6P6SF79_COFAR|nr:fasciclin-like arabinogalactan protein 13 [Coffea arabica]
MARTALSQLLALAPLLFLLLLRINAQSSTAPAPAPEGPINTTGILDKAGGFSTLIRLLDETQAGNQIDNQLNNSHDGMTLLAPTDNAFQNLPAGALNKLSDQQKVQLIQYHVIPKYYTLTSLQTVSNPVRTEASGQDGGFFGLNFTGQTNQNQVNVSSGTVNTPIYNVVRGKFPLAIYQLDKVMWPMEFNESKASAPVSSPPTLNSTRSGSGDGNTTAETPSTKSDAKSMTVGLSLISGLWLLCMGVLF